MGIDKVKCLTLSKIIIFFFAYQIFVKPGQLLKKLQEVVMTAVTAGSERPEWLSDCHLLSNSGNQEMIGIVAHVWKLSLWERRLELSCPPTNNMSSWGKWSERTLSSVCVYMMVALGPSNLSRHTRSWSGMLIILGVGISSLLLH